MNNNTNGTKTISDIKTILDRQIRREGSQQRTYPLGHPLSGFTSRLMTIMQNLDKGAEKTKRSVLNLFAGEIEPKELDKLSNKAIEKYYKEFLVANNELIEKYCSLVDEDQKTISCPYPNDKNYTEIWITLTPFEQNEMQENIKILGEGKLEILGHEFSILESKPNNVDVFDSKYKDCESKVGTGSSSYFTGESAERVCDEQGFELWETEKQVEDFINLFPGSANYEKCRNLARLFGLEKSGRLEKYGDKLIWNNLSFHIGLSKRLNDDGYGMSAVSDGLSNSKLKWPMPYIVFKKHKNI